MPKTENGRESADHASDADKYRLMQAQRLIDLADAYKRGAISQQKLEEELRKLRAGDLGGEQEE
jgi:hypothetical protein